MFNNISGQDRPSFSSTSLFDCVLPIPLFQGGGWCWNIGTCSDRLDYYLPFGHLVTSTKWPSSRTLHGIFNMKNTDWEHANLVYVPYCSRYLLTFATKQILNSFPAVMLTWETLRWRLAVMVWFNSEEEDWLGRQYNCWSERDNINTFSLVDVQQVRGCSNITKKAESQTKAGNQKKIENLNMKLKN